MDEVWKDIDGWEGMYQVSNKGKVRSLDRYIGKRFFKGTVLKGSNGGDGYRIVALCNGSKERSYPYIHRLVAEAFIGPVPPNQEVNHKDGDKSHNNISNLEYVTRRENTLHAMDIIGINFALGEQVGSSKLTEVEVLEMRRLYAAGGTSHRKLAKMFDVHHSTVARIVAGNSWSWLEEK